MDYLARFRRDLPTGGRRRLLRRLAAAGATVAALVQGERGADDLAGLVHVQCAPARQSEIERILGEAEELEYHERTPARHPAS